MTITPKTTIHSLLDEHPFLVDFLAAYNPEFQRLTNPVLRRTMGRMATLERAAALASVPLDALMIDIAAEIERVTGDRPMIADRAWRRLRRPGPPGGAQGDHPRPARRRADGRLKQRFATLIEDVDASEIAAMEQQLIAEGMTEQEVQATLRRARAGLRRRARRSTSR